MPLGGWSGSRQHALFRLSLGQQVHDEEPARETELVRLPHRAAGETSWCDYTGSGRPPHSE
jgi:hypothetical protein